MKHEQSGFTLIELLVAAALSLLLMSLVFQSMFSAQQVTTLTRSQSDSLDTLQAVTGMIGDDVRRANFIQPSLAAPAWLDVAKSSAAQSLNLQAEAGSECAVTYDVSYVLVPRTALTADSVNEWVKLPADPRNDDTSRVLLRATRCVTNPVTGAATVNTRLVADYLVPETEFSIAQVGSATYTSAPTSSTGGIPYLSTRFQVARSVAVKGGVVREPRTGTLNYVAASRTVEVPATP